MSSEGPGLTYEERAAVAFVRLARPARRNVLTGATLARLAEIFAGVARRRDLRAVVLGGEGADFCAGDDREELRTLDAEAARRRAELLRVVCASVESCGVPVVLALVGEAAGAGCELALACHLRVAAEDARLALPQTRPDATTTEESNATDADVTDARDVASAEKVLTTEVLTAGEALRRGLFNRVVAPAKVFAEAEALARAVIAEGAPLAARACLEAVTRGARLPPAEAFALETELFGRLFSTADAREGLDAFLEKRKPVFKGE